MNTIWTPERQAAARASCAKWAGTPHQNRLALPGEGIDCVRFVSEILKDAGIIDEARLPFYDERLGALRERNVIEDILTAYLHAEPLPPDAPVEFGDLVVCQCGRQTNHVGIIIDGAMWHVPGRGRCGPASWENWWRRAQSLVRITGTGYREDPASLTWTRIRTKL